MGDGKERQQIRELMRTDPETMHQQDLLSSSSYLPVAQALLLSHFVHCNHNLRLAISAYDFAEDPDHLPVMDFGTPLPREELAVRLHEGSQCLAQPTRARFCVTACRYKYKVFLKSLSHSSHSSGQEVLLCTRCCSRAMMVKSHQFC